jgi:protein TonB
MLNRLLESRAQPRRSLSGAATSITAHIVIIVVAVHATAQTRPRPLRGPATMVLPFVPPQAPAVTRPASQPPRLPLVRAPYKAFVFVPIDPKLPAIDLVISPTGPTDFPSRADGPSIRTVAEASSAGPATTFQADQVERQVSVLPGAPLPRYPEQLRTAGTEGRVVAEFTVTESGVIESDSVRFVHSDNVLFEESVRKVLKRMRFAPAEIGGRKVRQLVQMPFVFTLAGR